MICRRSATGDGVERGEGCVVLCKGTNVEIEVIQWKEGL